MEAKQIVASALEGRRRLFSPEALARGAAIESLPDREIALLALIRRWQGVLPLETKMAGATLRDVIADNINADPKVLAATLASLVAGNLVTVRRDDGFFKSKTWLWWSADGETKCYGFLNSWGWEKLAMALDGKHSYVWETGPPEIGGPGLQGWTSRDS